jgi:hypothetical protein
VRVVGQRVYNTYTICVIEDPEHPGFHYQLFERWLATSPPPPEPVPGSEKESLALPLSVLDKMVQMILIKNSRGKETEDDSSAQGGNGTDLGANPTAEQDATVQTSVLSGTPKGGRDSS